MKTIIQTILKRSAKFLLDVNKRLVTKPGEESYAYHSLSPINNAEDIEHYADALEWALKNRKKKDIKNIALTGPFGSGKSSILRTFQENNRSKDLFFLTISLASFKDERPDENGKSKVEDLLRLIELSILQQIFYHEEDHKIPDSRFKKIKHFKKVHRWLAATGTMIMLVALLYLFIPGKLPVIPGIFTKDGKSVETWQRFIPLMAVFVGIFIIILNSLRTLYSMSVNKLKIQNAEIEIGKNINKSILNNHLDEILYFFEATKYNVVIIEDLDRFEQTEIFTKLREINLLINNAKKIKKAVVFIYAIRDEMFQDKNRTKFFDFIIPVIPVINASNSNEILKKIVNQHKHPVSEELIEDVSLFIDDMRLLYNICNEYHIYHKNLDPKLNQTKLFSMVAYKNIYPKDFALLGNGGGELHKALTVRTTSIKNHADQIDQQINTIKSHIKNRENSKIKDKAELRIKYINAYIPHLTNFRSFHLNGTDQDFESLVKDDGFDYFMADKMEYVYVNNDEILHGKISKKFADIEKEVDPNYSYKEKEKQINDWIIKENVKLKLQIESLKAEKLESNHLKLHELITKGDIKINTNNEKQTQLVSMLLRNEYIDEDYLDYISIFYPESITKDDRQFLLNVKSQVPTDFNFSLHKIDKLLARISQRDLQQEAILNFSLLDYVLVNPTYKHALDTILSQLNGQSETSLTFIQGFIDNGANIGPFIQQLCKKWHGIWNHITLQSVFPDDKKRRYYQLIIANAETDDLVNIAKISGLKNYIENEEDVQDLIPDMEKLISVIKALDIKFTGLGFGKDAQDLSDYIYQRNHYRLNPKTIETIIKERGNYNKAELDTSHFQAVKNSGCSALISYITENIDDYIHNAYLKIDSNKKEPEDCFIELLNNEGIIHENRIRIIEQTTTSIKSTFLISNPVYTGLLLSKSQVTPLWDNLINYYRLCRGKFDDRLVTFLNNKDNIDTLTLEKIKLDNSALPEATVDAFWFSLWTNANINNISYDRIANAFPYSYDNFSYIRNLSQEKVVLLIKHQNLSLSAENYTALRKVFPGLHLALLETRFTEYLSYPKTLPLDADDVIILLSSPKLGIKKKKQFLTTISHRLIYSNNAVSQAIVELCLRSKYFNIDSAILKHVLLVPLEVNKKLKLLNSHIHSFSIGNITQILSTLPEPYSDIAIGGKTPLLDMTDLNRSLATNLQTVKYIFRHSIEDKGIRITTFDRQRDAGLFAIIETLVRYKCVDQPCD